MNKISFEDWKNSMSFMIDDKFDNNFLHSVEPLMLSLLVFLTLSVIA